MSPSPGRKGLAAVSPESVASSQKKFRNCSVKPTIAPVLFGKSCGILKIGVRVNSLI